MRLTLLPLFLFLACPETNKDSGDPPAPSDLDGDGYTTAEGDCDDEAATVSPGAEELCDNVDNNCNTEVDEGVLLQVYPDADGDGFGDAAALATDVCEVATGWVTDHTDCDDSDAAFHPEAAETDCTDPADYNCDGSVGFADADGDGFSACVDCDDGDAGVNSGAAEACNGIDDDCDGSTDEAGAVGETAWYADADADTYGDAEVDTLACEAPAGFVADATDCDDTSDRWHPGAEESDCSDPNDYNCDGSVGYANADGDGFAACQDCNDGDANVSPDAPETCNGIDDDCDSAVDEAGAGGELTWHADADGDGYGDAAVTLVQCDGPVGYVLDDTDCDDTDDTVFPGAPETCNGIDDDCDGTADGVDEVTWSTWYTDGDGDSYGDASRGTSACSQPASTVADATDCDDTDAAVFPGAAETCNGVDDDCDGSIDGVDEVTWTTWYADRDGDTYGDSAASVSACAQPGGYLADATDCDDGDAAVHPGAAETCDGQDEDCDGVVDGADEVSWSDWYADTDGDTYGDAAAAVSSCAPPAGYLADASDCDDGDASVYPGAPETCDGQDEDCDGVADGTDEVTWVDWYDDADGDTYGDPSTAVSSCSTLSGVSVGGDCNDASAAWHPGAPETDCADPSDYNCDGVVVYADADADTFAACEECDDTDPAVNPDAVESCNGVDDDCDGLIDNGAIDETTWYVDADGDGYGASGSTAITSCFAPSGYADNDDDCNDADAASHAASTGSQTFSYSGGAQTFTVPACVTQVTIAAYGAAGGRGTSVGTSVAGLGGLAQGTLSVTAGSTLYVYVGGTAGYNGGGAAWSGSSQACNGGGASDVRVGGTSTSDRVIVAGGGGGVCGETSWGNGGDGGGGTCSGNYCGGEAGAGYYLTSGGVGGSSGGSGVSGCHGGAGGGGGYASGGGGAVATCYGGATAGTGSLGSGGAGNCSTSGCCGPYGVAGGGGGYYGGGGAAGGCCGGGGAGGGSSWTGTLTSPSFAAGVRSGNGQVIVSW